MRSITTITAATAIALLAGVGAAQAATTTLQPGPGQYTFTGPAELTAAGQTADCTLSLTGSVSVTNNGAASINVTDGSVTGGGLCNLVTLVFDPSWDTTISQGMLPTTAMPSKTVSGTFHNVIVRYNFIGQRNCSNGPADVPATFTNGSPASDPSAFMFNTNIGSCSVNGTLKSTSDINVIVKK